MIDYSYLNTAATKTIYDKIVAMEPFYETDPFRYCFDARILTEKILKYLVDDCCGYFPDRQCGVNLDFLRQEMPTSVFPEKIQSEFSALLTTANNYHHDSNEQDTIHDRYTIKCALDYILPWLDGIDIIIQEYKEESKKKRRNRSWIAIIGTAIVGTLTYLLTHRR